MQWSPLPGLPKMSDASFDITAARRRKAGGSAARGLGGPARAPPANEGIHLFIHGQPLTRLLLGRSRRCLAVGGMAFERERSSILGLRVVHHKVFDLDGE